MPRYGPDGIFPPEIIQALERAMEDGNGSGADLEQLLAEAVDRYNHTPQPVLDGLTPDQAASLLASDWISPGRGVSINQQLTLAELEHIPLFRCAREFLAFVRDEGPLGVTSRGYLNRKAVARAMTRLGLEPDFMLVGKAPRRVTNEQDCDQLRRARELLEHATLIRNRQGFVITKAGFDALKPDRAGMLFTSLFLEAAGNPKTVMDVCDDIEMVLARLPLAVWRLSRYATGWTDTQDLAWVCWPMAPEEAALARYDAPGGDPQLSRGTSVFLLYPLTELGLLERRESAPGSLRFKIEFRLAPLFHRFFEFHV
jgi:hypothetical protein